MTASHTMDAPPRSRAEASLVPIRSRCRVHEALLHLDCIRFSLTAPGYPICSRLCSFMLGFVDV